MAAVLLERCLVVDMAVAAAVRAAVGPSAWFVVEALAAEAPPGCPVARVPGGCRVVASRVGLSKDTVARALRVLSDVGVVERVDRRDEVSGRFAAGEYVVRLDVAGLAVADAPALRSSPSPTGDSPTPVRSAPGAPGDPDGQLSLLR